MPSVVNYDRPYRAVRFVLFDLHGTDDRTRVWSLNEALYVFVARIIRQPNAAVEDQFVDVVQAELGSKDRARFGRGQGLSEKDPRDQLRNMPENDFHAEDGPSTLVRRHRDFRVLHAFTKSPRGEHTRHFKPAQARRSKCSPSSRCRPRPTTA